MSKIRVMLVEDEAVWIDCLSSYLQREGDIEIVCCPTTKKAAIDSFQTNSVDVAIVDIMLGTNSYEGLDTASELKRMGLFNIIMLTGLDERETILDSFDKGAINYILKTSYKDIPGAVRDAFYKNASIHSDVSQLLISELKKERLLNKILTPAEREVYELREKGMSRAEIAKHLFKSVETVKTQIKKINSKLLNDSAR